MGFPVPVGAWFRSTCREVIDEYVLSERAVSRGIFDPSFVRALVRRHQDSGEDHSERLWALVNFEIWQRRFFDGEDVSKACVPEKSRYTGARAPVPSRRGARIPVLGQAEDEVKGMKNAMSSDLEDWCCGHKRS